MFSPIVWRPNALHLRLRGDERIAARDEEVVVVRRDDRRGIEARQDPLAIIGRGHLGFLRAAIGGKFNPQI